MSVGVPFPVEDPRGASEKRARYRRVLDDRLSDRAYHYAVTLPRDWRPTALPTFAPGDGVGVGLLGQFRGPGESPARVEVSARPLDREIAPADWLLAYLESIGQSVVHSRRFPTPGGDVLDALTQGAAPDGSPVTSRWKALKDGDGLGAGRVVMSEARVPRERYAERALDLMWASSSLEIVNPSGWPYAERLRSHSAGLPGDFVFLYPYAWDLHERRADDTPGGIHWVELRNVVAGAPAGRLTFLCAGSAARPQDMIEPYLRALASRGVIARLGDLHEVPPFGGLSRAWARAGHGHPRMDAQGNALPPHAWPFDGRGDPFTAAEPMFDLEIRVGRRENAWYLIALAGEARARDPLAAAINARALAVILQTMHTERAG